MGLATWGEDRPAPALAVWSDELDRYGAPPADCLLAQHELMDSPGKARALLLGAGFHEVATAALGWSDRPTLTEFVDRHAVLGVMGRRLALLDKPARSAFLRDDDYASRC